MNKQNEKCLCSEKKIAKEIKKNELVFSTKTTNKQKSFHFYTQLNNETIFYVPTTYLYPTSI